MQDVERQLNAQVNGLIYEGDNVAEAKAAGQAAPSRPLQTKVWKRGSISVAARDSAFLFTVPLRIWAKAGVSMLGFTQYGETSFELNMRFVTDFRLNPDWSVRTQTRADGYDWVTKPTTRLVGFNVPITGIIDRIIAQNLTSITAALDEQVHRQIDLKTPVLKAWNTLREPYLLSDKYRTYLLVIPNRLLITPFRFEGNTIRSTIGVEGYTLTTTGKKPDVKPAVTLPDLAVVEQIRDDFRVGLVSEASHEEAARLAAEALVGKTFPLRDGAYSITIRDLELYGQDDFLIIRAGLTGSITGNIYLRGQPFYDPDSRSIRLRGLTYDLDTRSLLQRTANWLLQGTFARMLEKQLTIPIGTELEEIQKTLQARLKNNHLTRGVILNGTIDQIKPDGVYLTPTSILAVVYASGQLAVKVDGLQ